MQNDRNDPFACSDSDQESDPEQRAVLSAVPLAVPLKKAVIKGRNWKCEFTWRFDTAIHIQGATPLERYDALLHYVSEQLLQHDAHRVQPTYIDP